MKLDAYEKELLELDESDKISLDQSDETEKKSALMSAARSTLQKTNESIFACLERDLLSPKESKPFWYALSDLNYEYPPSVCFWRFKAHAS